MGCGEYFLVDYFGVPVSLNSAGRDKSVNTHGIICAILFSAFILWAIYDASGDLIAKKSPSTTSYQSLKQTRKKTFLNKDTFVYYFLIISTGMTCVYGFN